MGRSRYISPNAYDRLGEELAALAERVSNLQQNNRDLRTVLEVFADKDNWLEIKGANVVEFIGCGVIVGFKPWELAQKALNKEV